MAIKFTTQPVAKNATSRSLDSISAAECKLQDKTVEYVENSQYEILPDEGYDGIAKVDVTVNVPIPEPKLQSKNYNIVTNGDTTITPDAGFVGINGGTISVNVPTPEPNLQEKSTTISQNGASRVTPDSGYDGLSRVDITVQVPEQTIQANKTVSITANGQTIVSPDPNNDGMAQVTVDVNVSGGGGVPAYIPNEPQGVTEISNSEINTVVPMNYVVNESVQDLHSSFLLNAPELEFVHLITPSSNLFRSINYFLGSTNKVKWVTLSNTRYVTDFGLSFFGCEQLEYLGPLDMTNATDVSGMFPISMSTVNKTRFGGFYNLSIDLDLSKLDIPDESVWAILYSIKDMTGDSQRTLKFSYNTYSNNSSNWDTYTEFASTKNWALSY